jgi:Flp pilus assembly protein TadD
MARTEAETAIRLRKNFGESHAAKGIILAKQGKYREALPELSKGLSLGYRDAVTYHYLGIAYAQLGNLREALRAYEQGVALDPKFPAARLNLALQYKKLGQAEKARAQFDIVCKLSAELCRQYALQFAPKE